MPYAASCSPRKPVLFFFIDISAWNAIAKKLRAPYQSVSSVFVLRQQRSQLIMYECIHKWDPVAYPECTVDLQVVLSYMHACGKFA